MHDDIQTSQATNATKWHLRSLSGLHTKVGIYWNQGFCFQLELQ